MNLAHRLAMVALVMTMTAVARPLTPHEIATSVLAPLLDPGKIATLKSDRPVNARLYRIMGWLETARLAGGDFTKVITTAQGIHGVSDTPQAFEDRAALLQSWRELARFGCFTSEGIATLKKGCSPRIAKGEHAGDTIHLDHILPRSVVPELEARFHNLMPVPSEVNRRKGAKVTAKELKLAWRWNREGLLSSEGLEALRRVGRVKKNRVILGQSSVK